MAEAQVTEGAKLRQWFKGNEDAARLVENLFEVSQLVDDFVDRDQGHTLGDRRERAARLLHLALIVIPANPFHAKFQGWLAPLLSDAVLAWDMATGLEQGGRDTEKAFAFVYRDQLERMIVQVAQLIGGLDHARLVQEDVFAYFRFEHEDGQTYGAFLMERAKFEEQAE